MQHTRDFIELVKTRYATKSFDSTKLISQNDIQTLKEVITLTSSSFGLQPYKIKIISDKNLQKKLQEVSWNQPQVGSASHVFVLCANTKVKEQIDTMEKMVSNKAYIDMMRGWLSQLSDQQQLVWAQKQVYLVCANILHAAKALGFDSCPMEGFDSQAYATLLNLPSHLVPTLVVPVGYATDTPRKKIRYTDLFLDN
jgi:nitroreductase / dihydropteridine reductase